MKKFLAILLIVVLTAGISVGATLAYLTDTDAQVNTFTNGNVYIDLWEDFGDNDDAGIEKLLPAVVIGDEIRNAVEKEVYVTNTGSEDAYVRVHIAIPTLLATDELLHVVRTPGTDVDPYWNWATDTATVEIDGVGYTVYTLTYGSELAPDEVTVDAIAQVYLDGTVDNAKINELNTALGNEWKVYVCAQAAQTEGFDSAEQALTTAFGGVDKVDWEAVTGGSVNVKYTESDDVASVPTIITGELTTTGTGYGRQTVVGTIDKFENVTLTTDGGGISVWGTAVWNGGSITTNSMSTSPRHVFYVASGKDENGNVIADGHLTINGGEFTFSPGNLTRKGSYLCAHGAGATIIVNGGTFHKPSTRTAPIQEIDGGEVIIYGGTFCFDPSAYVADGYEAVESGGWWTVSAKYTVGANCVRPRAVDNRPYIPNHRRARRPRRAARRGDHRSSPRIPHVSLPPGCRPLAAPLVRGAGQARSD